MQWHHLHSLLKGEPLLFDEGRGTLLNNRQMTKAHSEKNIHYFSLVLPLEQACLLLSLSLPYYYFPEYFKLLMRVEVSNGSSLLKS